MITRGFLFSPGLPGERNEIRHLHQKKNLTWPKNIRVLCTFPLFWTGKRRSLLKVELYSLQVISHRFSLIIYQTHLISLKWQIWLRTTFLCPTTLVMLLLTKCCKPECQLQQTNLNYSRLKVDHCYQRATGPLKERTKAEATMTFIPLKIPSLNPQILLYWVQKPRQRIWIKTIWKPFSVRNTTLVNSQLRRLRL